MDELLALVPQSFDRYVEPFAGGAAMFFALRPEKAHLSDVNRDLINAYRCVAESPEQLIAHLQRIPNTEEEYYRVRSSVPTSELESAVRFLYLTGLSYNGVYRVNLKGEFNVPYGRRSHRPVCEPDHIRDCSQALRGARLEVSDFRGPLEQCGQGDLVYVDPPYTVAHNNNGFLRYNEKIFSWKDQQELAQLAEAAAQRGATVIVSNAFHQPVIKLYPTFTFMEVERFTSVSGEVQGRQRISEALFIRATK